MRETFSDPLFWFALMMVILYVVFMFHLMGKQQEREERYRRAKNAVK